MKNYKIKKRICRESGASLSSWLIFLVIAVLAIQLSVKVVPYYIDDHNVYESLTILSKGSTLPGMSVSDIEKRLTSQWQESGVNPQALEALQIKRVTGAKLITIDYDITIPLMLNVSILLSFRHYLDTSKPQKCCDPL